VEATFFFAEEKLPLDKANPNGQCVEQSHQFMPLNGCFLHRGVSQELKKIFGI